MICSSDLTRLLRVRFLGHQMITRVIVYTTLAVLLVHTSVASAIMPISLTVDARDGAHRLLHSELNIPVHAGPLVLVYPRWAIPTYEAPNTILDNIVDLRFTANGKPVAWHRDLVDMFTVHIEVPPGVRTLTVRLDVAAAPQRSDFNATTGQLVILDWNTMLLYPKGAAASHWKS